MHSSGSSQAPPTAPYPDRRGRWRCKSFRSDSPQAGSAATRRSSTEDKHTIIGISKLNQEIPESVHGRPSEQPPVPSVVLWYERETLRVTRLEASWNISDHYSAHAPDLYHLLRDDRQQQPTHTDQPSSAESIHSTLHSCRLIEVSDKRVRAERCRVRRRLGQNQFWTILSFINCHVIGFAFSASSCWKPHFSCVSRPESGLEESNDLSRPPWLIIPMPF